MQPKKPSSRFSFRAGSFPREENHLKVFFLFAEDTPSQLSLDMRLPDIKNILEKNASSGNFRSAFGEIFYLSHQNIILCGLGKKNKWHPEKIAELFRKLGAKLSSFRNTSVEIIMLQGIVQAVQYHRDQETRRSERLRLNLSAKARSASKNKSSSHSKEDSDDEIQYDYISTATVDELLSQLVVCMNLGAENMALLQSAKSRPTKKKQIPIGITTSFLKESAVADSLEKGKDITGMIQGIRYLSSLPGNYMNPAQYEKYARAFAKEHNLKVEVLNKQMLTKLGCEGIISVGKGSSIPPRIIALEYRPRVKKVSRPLVLVGKGVTFDTGGISIKPANEMHEMKYDMCGSALVLHAVGLAAIRKLPISVVALLGVAENMPDGSAVKPGDVYTAHNGVTVEVQNTDAEGRLVLGDLLSYASKQYSPLCMLDFATLTGSCVIALGHEATAVMTESDDLSSRIQKASRRSLDRVWRMPHWPIYGKELKSDIADIRNIGGRAAGTLSAMRFLSHFVKEDIPWAHFDIAGTAWHKKGSGAQCKGATGWGLRFLHCFMEDLVR